MAESEGAIAGTEWIVDAFDCDPQRLSSVPALSIVFERVIADLTLNPIGGPRFHTFPGAGGVTGFVLLAESHLSCHTFPENGFAAFDLFCCRERPDWDWKGILGTLIGARSVRVRRFLRGGATESESAS